MKITEQVGMPIHSIIVEREVVESKKISLVFKYSSTSYIQPWALKYFLEENELKLKTFKRRKKIIYYKVIKKCTP